MRKAFLIVSLILIFLVSNNFAGEVFKVSKTTILLTKPDIKLAFQPEEPICTIEKGTKIERIDTSDLGSIKQFWSKVRILEGDCKDKEGWLATENLER
jgi:hypothetical protein